MSSLALSDISVRYSSSAVALDDVNLEIGDGERLVLVGPSGSGKTTVLRVIAGLVAPTAGDVRFDGRSMNSVPPEKRGAVMVFQNHALLPYRSVSENVAFGLAIRKVGAADRQERVARALALVQLTGLEDRWPNELSGGQYQRVALARALVVEPKVLLLDEPLSSLDRSLRDELAEVIDEAQRRLAITTVMVTHDEYEARLLGDRVAVLAAGRLDRIGPPEQVLGSDANAHTGLTAGSSGTGLRGSR